MGTTDILIGGGGIIGLSAALELAQSGFRVTVLERGRVMREASWAAAGMLAAEDPENPPEIAELAAFSRRIYPEYLRKIEQLSGIAVPLRTTTTIQIARSGQSFHCLESETRYRITAPEAQSEIPGLVSGGRSLLLLKESSFDPRDLCMALPAAATAAGVELQQNSEILSVEGTPGLVRIHTQDHMLTAAAFVDCCGAWAGRVENSLRTFRLSTAPAIEPRKGQIIKVLSNQEPPLQCVVRTPEVYLVPRGTGHIVIGATLERARFDRAVESRIPGQLLAQAAELWPPIAAAEIVESWAGLRPGTIDNLPLLGPAGDPNCWVATGHFRNGILLAPATAVVMRQLIEGSRPLVPLDAFYIDRLMAG